MEVHKKICRNTTLQNTASASARQKTEAPPNVSKMPWKKFLHDRMPLELGERPALFKRLHVPVHGLRKEIAFRVHRLDRLADRLSLCVVQRRNAEESAVDLLMRLIEDGHIRKGYSKNAMKQKPDVQRRISVV